MSKHKKAHRARRASEGASGLSASLRATLIALPITLLLGVGLLLAATALLLSTKDPDRYHTVVSLPILYLTAFLGGIIATRIAHRHSPFLCGTALGAMLALLFSLVALFLPEGLAISGAGYAKFLLRLVVVPAAVLGALLGAREKKRKHAHRR